MMGLAELRARSRPDECPFCGYPKAQRAGKVGRPPLTCGEPECRTAYQRHYKRDERTARFRREENARQRVSRREIRARIRTGVLRRLSP
jgi:uncharacterized Zn finger protein (UPF0148 family)